MDFGNRLSRLRKEKNMTQTELADLLYVSAKTVSSWESSRTEPSIELIADIARIFDCSTEYLIFGEISKTNIETEIKIRINEKEYKYLKDYLNSNSKFIYETNQSDSYYQVHHKNSVKDNVNEWLRIRQSGNRNVLTYKNWHDNVRCDEYEVNIDDKDNLEKIFKIIDLEEIVTVDKNRTVFLYKDKYEISLDNVKNLGYFIEIEIKKYTDDIDVEYKQLFNVAYDLHIDTNNIEINRYPLLLINKDDN